MNKGTLCNTYHRATKYGGAPAIGQVENRKCWKITKPQVDPIDAHKNKTICMI